MILRPIHLHCTVYARTHTHGIHSYIYADKTWIYCRAVTIWRRAEQTPQGTHWKLAPISNNYSKLLGFSCKNPIVVQIVTFWNCGAPKCLPRNRGRWLVHRAIRGKKFGEGFLVSPICKRRTVPGEIQGIPTLETVGPWCESSKYRSLIRHWCICIVYIYISITKTRRERKADKILNRRKCIYKLYTKSMCGEKSAGFGCFFLLSLQKRNKNKTTNILTKGWINRENITLLDAPFLYRSISFSLSPFSVHRLYFFVFICHSRETKSHGEKNIYERIHKNMFSLPTFYVWISDRAQNEYKLTSLTCALMMARLNRSSSKHDANGTAYMYLYIYCWLRLNLSAEKVAVFSKSNAQKR